MAKSFSTSIVAEVFGGSVSDVRMDAVPAHAPGGGRARVQSTVILSEEDYAHLWDEVDRRRRTARARGEHSDVTTSTVVREAVRDFLALDVGEREAWYATVVRGTHRTGIRIDDALRARIEDEAARRVACGCDRSRATNTSVIVAALHAAQGAGLHGGVDATAISGGGCFHM